MKLHHTLIIALSILAAGTIIAVTLHNPSTQKFDPTPTRPFEASQRPLRDVPKGAPQADGTSPTTPVNLRDLEGKWVLLDFEEKERRFDADQSKLFGTIYALDAGDHLKVAIFRSRDPSPFEATGFSALWGNCPLQLRVHNNTSLQRPGGLRAEVVKFGWGTKYTGKTCAALVQLTNDRLAICVEWDYNAPDFTTGSIRFGTASEPPLPPVNFQTATANYVVYHFRRAGDVPKDAKGDAAGSANRKTEVNSVGAALTKEEEEAYDYILTMVGKLETVKVGDIEGLTEKNKNKTGLALAFAGTDQDKSRSMPQIGYSVWSVRSLVTTTYEHYYDGKLIRIDEPYLISNVMNALRKKHGDPKTGPRLEWMKARYHKEADVGNYVYWECPFTIQSSGRSVSLNVVLELAEVKEDGGMANCIISACDIDAAEKVGKALAGK